MKKMHMQKDSGITLVTLVITVIVLIILTFTLGINIDQYVRQNEYSNFQSDMATLEEEIDQYYARLKSLPIINKYTNTAMLTGKKNVNDNENYYVIDLRQLEVTLYNGKDYETIFAENRDTVISDPELTDVFIINEKTHTIYYPKGLVYNGEVLYSIKRNYTPVKETTKISTPQDLVNFRNRVNAGYSFEGELILLENDIDLSSVCNETLGNWTPIGTTSNAFEGTFNGNGHKINNLYINSVSDYQGLFGLVRYGTIKNLSVYGYIKGNKNIGGLIGYCGSQNILNCNNYATIESSDMCTGGISGGINVNNIDINIENCSNYGTVTSTRI